MASEWIPTKAIQMSVQSAELQLIGFGAEPELNMTCSLINIARGHCHLNIKQRNGDISFGAGSLHIPMDRPVIKGDIGLVPEAFFRLCDFVKGTHPRPVTLVAALETELAVSVQGDLKIDRPMTLDINDISWIVPLS